MHAKDIQDFSLNQILADFINVQIKESLYCLDLFIFLC